jgi:hypothetical protein
VKKYKRDRNTSYVGIERRTIFRCESWRSLSLRAKLFYIHLKAHYDGTNNGSIELHFSELSAHPGFNSKRAFYGAAKELISAGWVTRTNSKQSGLYRNPNTYELTGKYDGYAIK